MDVVAGLIADVLGNVADEAKIAAVKSEVNALMKRFPLYAGRLA